MTTRQQESWKGRRVLVTGATGIIGSWLTKELLARDAEVVALVRDQDPQSELFRSGDINRVSVVNGELEDYRTCERAINEHEVDSVMHLGAQTIVGAAARSPLATLEANIKGTYNILEACRVHSSLVQRIVVASSDKAYGESDTLPYTEDMPLRANNPYDVSKSCADMISQAYQNSYDLPVAILRCGNVYGGGDLNWSRIVPGTIRSLKMGEAPIIRSDGAYVRDYIYVEDVAKAYVCVAEQLERENVQGEAFNVSNESPVTVREIVETIQDMMDGKHLTPVVLNRAAGEIRDQHLSAAKAKKTLAWKSEFDLKSGLAETIKWYDDFFA